MHNKRLYILSFIAGLTALAAIAVDANKADAAFRCFSSLRTFPAQGGSSRTGTCTASGITSTATARNFTGTKTIQANCVGQCSNGGTKWAGAEGVDFNVTRVCAVITTGAGNSAIRNCPASALSFRAYVEDIF